MIKISKFEYIKSMEFCQNTISRMAKNSFHLKVGFLFSYLVLFTFFLTSIWGDTYYHAKVEDIVWLLPLLVFPILDAYYLKQERMFIRIYNDFMVSLNESSVVRRPFDLKPTKKQRNEFSLVNVIFSVSIGWFYFVMLSTLQAIIILHTTLSYNYLLTSLFPIVVSFIALTSQKQTHFSKD